MIQINLDPLWIWLYNNRHALQFSLFFISWWSLITLIIWLEYVIEANHL